MSTYVGRMDAFQPLFSETVREQWCFDLVMPNGYHVPCMTTGSLREALMERHDHRDPTLATDVVEVAGTWTLLPHYYADTPGVRQLHVDRMQVVGHSTEPRAADGFPWWFNPFFHCYGEQVSVAGTVRRFDVERLNQLCYTRVELDSGVMCVAWRAEGDHAASEAYRQWVDGLPKVGEPVAVSGLRGAVTDSSRPETGRTDIVLVNGPGCQFGAPPQVKFERGRPGFGGIE